VKVRFNTFPDIVSFFIVGEKDIVYILAQYKYPLCRVAHLRSIRATFP